MNASLIGHARKWAAAILLGLATIGAYGTAYYAIGVLIPAIHEDTGWSRSNIALGYSGGLVLQGGVALLAGRIFDRYGAWQVMLPALGIGSVFLIVASLAASSLLFVLAWAFGAAVIGGGLYYSVTMPVIARLYQEDRAAALSVLTLLGALASPIFYPLAGWMVDSWGWRVALQGLVVVMGACVAPAAVLVRAPAPVRCLSSGAGMPLREILRNPDVRRLLLVLGIAGVASSGFILNQVPAMEATGLSLTTAASFAGVRGAFQIPGRLVLTPLTRRFGVPASIVLCYVVASTTAIALLIAVLGVSPYLMAIYFCVLGGMSLGLLSPLNGLFQAEVFGDERLGVLSGAAVIVGSVAGALGGFLSSLLIDLSGGYALTLLLASMLYLGAAALMKAGVGAARTPREPSSVVSEGS